LLLDFRLRLKAISITLDLGKSTIEIMTTGRNLTMILLVRSGMTN